MKQLRLSEEQLAALLAKSQVRVVRPMDAHAEQPQPKRERPASLNMSAGHTDKWAGELAKQINLAGLAAPKREFRFAADQGRKYRADLAWPDRKFICEVDGGVHAIRKRWKSTVLKTQAAQELGYRVLTVMPEQVKSGEALRLVEQELAK